MKDEFELKTNRRTALKLMGAAIPVLALSATDADASQMAQKFAHYIPKTKNGKTCSSCKFFEAPHACKVVKGNIDPDGWCMLWRKS